MTTKTGQVTRQPATALLSGSRLVHPVTGRTVTVRSVAFQEGRGTVVVGFRADDDATGDVVVRADATVDVVVGADA